MGMKQVLIQTQTQKISQDPFDENDYFFLKLGHCAYGVSNDEGYSRIFISLGREKSSIGNHEFPWTIVRITEKFYYTNSSNPHHIDEEFVLWTGQLIDNLNAIKNKTKKGENNG